MDNKGINIYEFEKAETPIQQAVLNCIDSFNRDLQARKFDEQYRLDARIYDANKSVLIGVKKPTDARLELIYICTIGKTKETIQLWHTEVKLDLNTKGEINESKVKQVLDQCFLTFMKECFSLYALVSKQKEIQKKEQLKLNVDGQR